MQAIQKLRKFLLNTDGTTVVEYALLLSLVLTVIFAAVEWAGISNGLLYRNSNDSMHNAGLGQ